MPAGQRFAAAIVGIVPALQATAAVIRHAPRMTWTILIVAQTMALLPASVFNAWDGMRNGMAEPGFAVAVSPRSSRTRIARRS
jgi:hypothetical protein